MSNQQFPPFDDTVLEGEAVNWTTNWRDYIGKYEPADQYIRAFNLPMEDILELANNFGKNCPSVRAYIGMQKKDDISTLKLLVVPVDANNKDILSVPLGSGQASTDAAEQSSIFDYSSPCPQNCDLNSPLFGS